MTGQVFRDRDAEFERRAAAAFTAEPPGEADKPAAEMKESPTAAGSTEELPLVLNPSDPLANARRFVADIFTRDDRATLVHHRGEFFTWIRSHYRRLDETDLRARLYEYLESAQVKDGDALRPFRPTTRRVAETLDALRAAAHLASEITPPAWLEQVCDLHPSEIVACCNGLLHLPEMQLLGHDPDYFATSALPVAFDPFAPEPTEWLSFLRSVWGTDEEAIGTLQEAFGYCLTSDTRQHKIFLLVGPKRAGKGTIARVLAALLGKENVAGPTLGALSSNFGLAPLIGKPLAIISDARLSGRTDQAVIVERLLSISGEDILTVDRKNREPWTGTLPTKFLLLSNELPRLADASGAMASRFVVLTMSNSFYGREDTGLFDSLRGELPGILRWGVEGLQRLRERGRFIQPRSSAEAIRDLEDLGSPVGAFARHRCEVGPGKSVTTDDLYAAWRAWCHEQGREHTTNRQTFGRDLRAAVPGLATKQRREALQIVRFHEGISLM